MTKKENGGPPISPMGMDTAIPKLDLMKKNINFFMEDVTMQSMEPLCEWIVSSNLSDNPPKELTLVICSRGGDLNACFALVDVMRGSKIPIKTIGLGMIASCGLLMFISGTKGRRILTPNTAILSHQYSWGSIGKEHELFARVKEMELTTTRILEHYKKCTGLNEKKIRQFLLPPHDVWLGAEDAKKLKLCDKIENIY
ncbi:MAG TPA: ATP-dependent Clp protease proteolytic subunit [Candidatus Poseidoniia archaeon]|nr:ATP-dependent Clp protease proteolytic subunit [Candidatus Poseidoniia archaeon]